MFTFITHPSQMLDEYAPEEAEEAPLVRRVASLCRKRAYASPSPERKTLSTIAAEVLGCLPPAVGAADAVPELNAFVSGRGTADEQRATDLADAARVAAYTLCASRSDSFVTVCLGHAHAAHGLVANRATGAVCAILRILAIRRSRDGGLEGVQEGCIHALAMLAVSEAQTAAIGHTDEPEPLVSVVGDHKKTNDLLLPPLLIRIGSYGQTDDLARGLNTTLAAVSDDDTRAATVEAMVRIFVEESSSALVDGFGSLRIGCVSALAQAAQHLVPQPRVLSVFAAAVGASAVASAAAVICPRSEHLPFRRDSELPKHLAASWLQVVFVLFVGIKGYPRFVSPVDVFSVGLEAARSSPSSDKHADIHLRDAGVKLLAAVIGVQPTSFDRLPPASAMQAHSALSGIAAMDPSPDLRQLAAKVVHALQTDIIDGPRR